MKFTILQKETEQFRINKSRITYNNKKNKETPYKMEEIGFKNKNRYVWVCAREWHNLESLYAK